MGFLRTSFDIVFEYGPGCLLQIQRGLIPNRRPSGQRGHPDWDFQRFSLVRTAGGTVTVKVAKQSVASLVLLQLPSSLV